MSASDPPATPAPAAPPRLDFDTWARLSARLLKRSDQERAAILAAERVDPEASVPNA